MLMYPSCVVFFKQKTAYEMRIRDWSSDVCSSDLITSLQILPGSANLVGGRGVTLKNVPATSYQAMKFPDAPWGMKMACGENPKRVYGQKGGPSTRMGNVAGYSAAFIHAAEDIKQKAKDKTKDSEKHNAEQRKSLR